MAVAVDEAGAQDVASDVELRPGFGHVVGRTYGCDAPVAHADAAFAPGVAIPSTMRALVKSRSSMNVSPLSAEHDAARQSGQGADGAVGIEFGLVVPALHFPNGQRDAAQGRAHGVRRKAAGLRLIEQLEKTERGTGRPFRRGKTRGMM